MIAHNNIKKSVCQLVVLVLGIYLTVVLSRDLLNLIKKGERIKTMEEEAARLIKKNQELKAKLEYVKSDEFVEKMARNRLNMTKKDEMIVVLPVDELPLLRKNVKKKKGEDLPNWQRWWRLFFK